MQTLNENQDHVCAGLTMALMSSSQPVAGHSTSSSSSEQSLHTSVLVGLRNLSSISMSAVASPLLSVVIVTSFSTVVPSDAVNFSLTLYVVFGRPPLNLTLTFTVASSRCPGCWKKRERSRSRSSVTEASARGVLPANVPSCRMLVDPTR